MTAQTALFDAEIRHAVYLERYKGGLINKLIALLNRADADLVGKLISRDVSNATTARLERILDEIRVINRDAYNLAGKELTKELKELAIYEAGWQLDTVNDIVSVNTVRVHPEQLWSAVNSRPFPGRYLNEWFKGLEPARFARLRDSIRIGVVEGETLPQIVQRIRGTKANQFQDGILDIDRRGAQAIARTAVNHTVTAARNRIFEANADIYKGWEFSATLDGRTSAICRGLDGQFFKIGKGPMPPRHVNCRSSQVPVLSDDLAWLQPVGERATKNGPIRGDTTYNTWLRTQPRSFVEEVLGKQKAKLYLDGRLPLDRFINRRGDELTLEELRKKESGAFNRAGLAA